MITFLNIYQLCINERIRGEARNVLDWLVINVKTGNLVSGVTQQRIADDTRITRTNVSRCLARLEVHDILAYGQRGEIYLNPYYFFLGNAAQHSRSCYIWDEHQAEKLRAEFLPGTRQNLL